MWLVASTPIPVQSNDKRNVIHYLMTSHVASHFDTLRTTIYLHQRQFTLSASQIIMFRLPTLMFIGACACVEVALRNIAISVKHLFVAHPLLICMRIGINGCNGDGAQLQWHLTKRLIVFSSGFNISQPAGV